MLTFPKILETVIEYSPYLLATIAIISVTMGNCQYWFLFLSLLNSAFCCILWVCSSQSIQHWVKEGSC